MFDEISRNFRAGTLARSFGTQLARSSENAAPRDSLFILLHATASRGHPPWACGSRGTFFEDFRPAGRFFSNQQIQRLCRTLAGESRTGRFRRELLIHQKRGSVVSTPEEGGKRHSVEYLFCEQFF